MAKKELESLAQGKHQEKKEISTKKKKIDFSDIPELTNRELKMARRVGRPQSDNAKQMIAFRINPKLLMKLRKLAKKQNRPYQTIMHELLELSVKRVAS